MINVTIFVDEKQTYTGFDVIGHAGYDEYGHDIVCAATSVLIINTLNSIESFTEDETSCVSDEDIGNIEFRFTKTPGHDAQLLMKSMVLGLQSMEEDDSYKPYIDIIFEEV